MVLKRFEGVIAAAPTLFDSGGEIDEKATRALMEHYVSSQLNGVFLLSSTGEYFTLSQKKREQFVETAAEQIGGRLPLMVMVSDACLDTVKENIRIMASKSVDALVLTAPYYYKYTQNELYHFFTEASEASPLPLLVYNQPSRLPNELGEELVIQLSKHPNIIGIKDTSADTVRMMRLMRYCKSYPNFLYYAGAEGVAAYAAMLETNFVYALASVKPELFLEMRRLGQKKDMDALMHLQKKVDKLCGMFSSVRGGSAASFSNFAYSIKIALETMGIGEAHVSQFDDKPDKDAYDRISSILKCTE